MSRILRTAVWMGVLAVLITSAGSWGAAPEPAPAPPKGGKALQVYFVDVEGGQATLFVTPAGKSLLVDTGWPGFDGRDANRIAAAAKDAKISKIDFVLVTHYHRDHAGGLAQLLEKVPVGGLIDHGENRERSDAATEKTWQEYLKASEKNKLKRLIVKVGDVLPLAGVEARVISSDGALIDKPLPGAGKANPACAATEPRPADKTENQRSLGTLFTFGKLRILNLADLTWEKERELMCPNNKVGPIDIYIVSHHGWEQSGSPALVHGISPRVAIMDNGATKGGSPSSWEIVKTSTGLEDFWQLHFSEPGGPSHNVAAPYIANLSGTPDAGNYLKLSAWPEGRFEVFNSRTKETKEYAATR